MSISLGALMRITGHDHDLADVKTIINSCATCAKIGIAFEEGYEVGFEAGREEEYQEPRCNTAMGDLNDDPADM